MNPTPTTEQDKAKIAQLADIKTNIIDEINKVIVGQEKVIELLLISLMSSGHSLFVGVPGLAKTLLVSTLSDILNLKFNRVQFTPDLMPSDITGSEILEMDNISQSRVFKFLHGPVFCNILLADEINRASPKTQAALLQAMQEKKVTVGGDTYPIAPPFLVFATQNPIEQEGTYPLPEAELDRFMFQIDVKYPSYEEELRIVKTTTGTYRPELKKILDSNRIIEDQSLVERVPVSDNVASYAVKLARSTRPEDPATPKKIRDSLSWGVGPRASQFLITGAKARAALDGRYTPTTEDVAFVAPSVLKHRLVLNFRAEAEGITPDNIVEEILYSIDPADTSGLLAG